MATKKAPPRTFAPSFKTDKSIMPRMISVALTIEPNKMPGGPSTFVRSFSEWIQENADCGIVVTPLHSDADAILVIGEAGNFRLVDQYRKNGAKVVFRIDGKRRVLVDALWTAFSGGGFSYDVFFRNARKFFRFQIRALRLMLVADACVFQSNYIYQVWRFGRLIRRWNGKGSNRVIYNGTSAGGKEDQAGKQCLSLKKIQFGTLRVVTAKGWIHNTAFLNTLLKVLDSPQFRAYWLKRGGGCKISFDFYGNTTHIQRIRQYWNMRSMSNPTVAVNFHGASPPETVSEALGSSEVKGFLVTEDRPACPNAVIEAQIKGLLVFGRNVGALSEMVCDESHLYEGNPRSRRKVYEWAVTMVDLMIEGDYSPEKVSSFAARKFGADRFREYADLLWKTVGNKTDS